MALSTLEGAVEAQPAAPILDASAAISPPRHDAWVWYVTSLSIVLGVMLALAIRTTSRIRRAGLPESRFGLSGAVYGAYREQADQQQRQIDDLNRKLRSFQNSVEDRSRTVEVLMKQLQEFKAAAGLCAVTGPGLKITLRDSPDDRLPGLPPEDLGSYLIHDSDIYGLWNELKAAGAEALAISGADGKELQRVIVTTAARCVGPTALVNGVSLAAPYTIYAIGSPKNLRKAVEMRNGFIDSRGLDVLKMIVIEEAQDLVLPEYAGSFGLKYARPAPSDH